jgi:peptidoglycan hydrolase-like protein with peptidoglycan-binding domain
VVEASAGGPAEVVEASAGGPAEVVDASAGGPAEVVEASAAGTSAAGAATRPVAAVEASAAGTSAAGAATRPVAPAEAAPTPFPSSPGEPSVIEPPTAAPPLLPPTNRRRLAILAAVAVVAVIAAGVGVASAVGDSGGGTRAGGRPPTTEAPTTTVPPTTTTTVPPTTTTVPPESTTTLPPETTTTLPPDPAADGTLELNEDGDAVLALQQRLVDLGYWLGGGPDGHYGQLTRQAVMAFQKVEGLTRDGVAGPVTQERLAGASRPTPRGGDGLEIDLERQVLFVVEGGQVRYAINTSTGSGEAYTSSSGGSAVAATPPGQYAIERQFDGVREAPLGTLYRPKYFNGGIAVHGSGSIPAHPASHGCARVTNSAMDMLWASGRAEIGTSVLVY